MEVVDDDLPLPLLKIKGVLQTALDQMTVSAAKLFEEQPKSREQVKKMYKVFEGKILESFNSAVLNSQAQRGSMVSSTSVVGE